MYYSITKAISFSVISLCCLSIFNGCVSEAKNPSDANENEKEYEYFADWDLNFEYLQAGCEGGYDCIKSIDHPKFISVEEAAQLLSDNDLVVGIRINNEVRCYPHRILDWHEMVNDEIDGNKFTVNYCPLTGSAMAWNRIINGKETSFGVSGLLFNSNVIPYDRETGSHWSQMKQECVNGKLYKQNVECFPVMETTWATWKTLYPQTKVLSFDTGFTRDYSNYPYFDYKESEDIFFDVEFENDSLFQKERVFGLREGDNAKCYRFDNFKHGIQIISDSVFSKNVILIGSEENNFIVAFENKIQGKKLQFVPATSSAPALIQDGSGNLFDAFGTCIQGPLKGEQLPQLKGFTAYWFAWAAFYPELSIYRM